MSTRGNGGGTEGFRSRAKRGPGAIFRVSIAISLLFAAHGSLAQSIVIPTVAVVRGDTAEIPVEFVAGGGATNFDFVMQYNPAVVDESSLAVTCSSTAVGLTTIDCHIDTVNDEIRGIGVNRRLTPLTTGVFALISLPVFPDAATGESATTFRANFAAASTTTPFDVSWTPRVNESYCNVRLLSGTSTSPSEVSEACELLVVDTGYVAQDGASVMVSSGWQIEFMPGLTIELGATFDAAVCGRSLCETSQDPMPYGCHSCVVQICDIDPSCCESEFSQSCLDKVNTVCGLVCE